MSHARLDGAPGPTPPLPELLAGVRPRERAPRGRPFVYLNMVQSADGRAALGGSTKDLGSDADTELLTELRALADAVLIGTGTLAAEGYGRLVGHPGRVARRTAAGLPPTPLAVLFSRTGRIPWDTGLLAAADQPVLVYTGPAGAAPPPGVRAPVEVVALREPTPAAMLADLRRRGVRALLCEGGPSLLGALLEARVVDELFLTLAPLLTADDDAPRVVQGTTLPAPAALTLRWVLRCRDEVYLRYGVHPG